MRSSLTGFTIVPNLWMPENTIVVGPKTYEILTGVSYKEAMKTFGKALEAKRKAQHQPKEKSNHVS